MELNEESTTHPYGTYDRSDFHPVESHDRRDEDEPLPLDPSPSSNKRKKKASSSSKSNNNNNNKNDDASPKPKRTRNCQAKRLSYTRSDGTTIDYTFETSNWFALYIANPRPNDPSFETQFRRRFRIPYPVHLELYELIKDEERFRRWQNKDATGKQAAPMELMLLGALRVITRQWTFEDISEATGVSTESNRLFFHLLSAFETTPAFDAYASNHSSYDFTEFRSRLVTHFAMRKLQCPTKTYIKY